MVDSNTHMNLLCELADSLTAYMRLRLAENSITTPKVISLASIDYAYTQQVLLRLMSLQIPNKNTYLRRLDILKAWEQLYEANILLSRTRQQKSELFFAGPGQIYVNSRVVKDLGKDPYEEMTAALKVVKERVTPNFVAMLMAAKGLGQRYDPVAEDTSLEDTPLADSVLNLTLKFNALSDWSSKVITRPK